MKNELKNNNQADEITKVCIFCSEPITHMRDHITNCKEVSFRQLSEKRTFFKVGDRGHLCKRCGILFTPKEWDYHRRTQPCKHLSNHDQSYRIPSYPDLSRSNLQPSQPQSNLSHNSARRQHPQQPQFAQNIQQQHSLINIRERWSHPEKAGQWSSMPGESKYFSEGRYKRPEGSRFENDGDSQPVRELIDLGKSLLTPYIRDWADRHQQMDIKILVAYFTTATLEFALEFFQRPVFEPTWEEFRKVSKEINWVALLGKPSNIFIEGLVDRKIAEITSTRMQGKVIRAINKISLKYKGMIKKRNLPSVQRANSRSRIFVRMKDLVLTFRTLLETKRKETVHVALDMYIILVAGMRFLADKDAMENGIRTMLERNKTRSPSDLDLTFIMEIGKNKVKQQVCLNSQICLMLNAFGWKAFHRKTYRIVSRMTQWLGIRGYVFKDVILNAAAAERPDLKLSQRLAGHLSISSTKIYAEQALIGTTLKVIDKIVIPGMDKQFGAYNESQVLNFYDSLCYPHIRYTPFRENWLDLFFKKLYSERYSHRLNHDQVIDLTAQPSLPALEYQPEFDVGPRLRPRHQEDHDDEIREEEKDDGEERQGEKQIVIVSEKEKDLKKLNNIVLVYGNEYVFVEGKFQQFDFFHNLQSYQKNECLVCQVIIPSGQIRLRCVFCLGHQHVSCAGKICRCTDADWLIGYPPKAPLSPLPRLIDRTLTLPRQYLQEGTTPSEQEIKCLLTIRRLKYTRIPVVGQGCEVVFPQNFSKELYVANVDNYQDYVEGRYFPPIQLKVIGSVGNHSVFGSQVGIFATQSIAENIVIGEYAADLLMGKMLSLCRKSDSIMSYSGGNTPNDVFVGPKDFSGYVLLVNSGKPETNNCATLRAVIDGAVRIILYTAKKIKKGQQLLYQYGESYEFENRHFDSASSNSPGSDSDYHDSLG